MTVSSPACLSCLACSAPFYYLLPAILFPGPGNSLFTQIDVITSSQQYTPVETSWNSFVLKSYCHVQMEPEELMLTFNCVKEQNVRKKSNNIVCIVHLFDYLIFEGYTLWYSSSCWSSCRRLRRSHWIFRELKILFISSTYFSPPNFLYGNCSSHSWMRLLYCWDESWLENKLI